ncbi:MAG: 2-keto-4-pentenoate hydratase/2-oxohepta-3-ene-1,7-dioic acid hydratase in catechol pathway [Candidatus Nitrosomirales archaeon]|jgi:2-keto-4-pentenoate hydratase/2-oxohepta-3-ene-1,7-dioic acid hydratase in catechol pathway
MKIARIKRDSMETYALVQNDKMVGKEELERQLETHLPDSIEEFLFGDHIAAIQRTKLTAVMNEPYKLLPPISKPSKIICLGYNYIDHAKEQGATPPQEPVIFMKPRTTLIGAHGTIVCPKFVIKLDYEGELAFVIKKNCKNVKQEEAMNYVLGYMVFNDVSARDIQFGDKQWTRGKSFDTFAPCGPWITTKDEINDPHNLQIVTKVNGEVRQNSSTKNMALKIDKIVASLSKVMTLEQGDIIATGTPSGVAVFMSEPRFLKHGDVVEVEIEGLGKLRNDVAFVDH